MRPRNEQPAVKLILRALETDDLTAYELSECIGINIRNVRPYMKLLKDQKLVHVLKYECHGNGPKVPRWSLGDEPSAGYPARRTHAEQQRITRARKLWAQQNKVSA